MAKKKKIGNALLYALLITGCSNLFVLQIAGCSTQAVRKEIQADSVQAKTGQKGDDQPVSSINANGQKGDDQLVSSINGDGQKENDQPVSGINENVQQHKDLKTTGWRIQDGCRHMTEALAEDIYQDVLALEQELCDQINEIENSRIIYLTEETKENAVFIRAVFEADYTVIRKPEDHPMIQGMYEAADELLTEQEKKAADAYIDGHLKELYPLYQQTNRVPLDVVVKLDADSSGYQLYYPYVENNKEKLKPLHKYAVKNWKEDPKQMKRMGRKILLDNVHAG